ncbi:hypothetical protein GCM10009556_001140 [Acrocarpospora pleiomorpha]
MAGVLVPLCVLALGGAVVMPVAKRASPALEADWMNEMGRTMAAAHGEVVSIARQDFGINVRFADPIFNGDFEGEGVCGDPETIHAVITDKTAGENPGEPVSQQSFHPKISGYLNYTGTLNRELRNWGL